MSNEMGLTREEMNQIVGGTTFTGSPDPEGPSGNDVCDKQCVVCAANVSTINICSGVCKSKSKKLTDITL